MTDLSDDVGVAKATAKCRATSEAPAVNLTADAQLEQVRTMLLGPEQAELVRLRSRVAALEALVPRLLSLEEDFQGRVQIVDERQQRVEQLVLATEGRATAVAEVLVDAVATPAREFGVLGDALAPEVARAVHSSARIDSAVLAEALYPVMGPALRKMIAELFSMNSTTKGQTFVVQQVLLIDREAGLMLASSTAVGDEVEESVVVSGMLDAIRHFVQDAFGTPDHDGLQDLRVGDTSVLVEWGPNAALASVVTGVPTGDYRRRAAQILEQVHDDFATELNSFEGDTAPFEAVRPQLNVLFQAGTSAQESPPTWLTFVLGLLLLGLFVGALFLVL